MSVSPVSSKNHSQDGRAPLTALRDGRRETLFIYARKLGFMKDRVLRDFTKEDVGKIVGNSRAWRSSSDNSKLESAIKANLPTLSSGSMLIDRIRRSHWLISPAFWTTRVWRVAI